MIKLYDKDVSGNAYKIRLFLSLLNLDYQSVAVDMAAGEHKQAPFLKLNPRGQVPVLDDDGLIIWDSMAILVYLARRYGGEDWLPTDAPTMAKVMQWLAFSENEVLYGLARARAIKLFKRPWDPAPCREMGVGALKVLEEHLAQRKWLVGEGATIADIACYPYVALAPEGDIRLDDYPRVRQWFASMQSLPGYVGMPGL